MLLGKGFICSGASSRSSKRGGHFVLRTTGAWERLVRRAELASELEARNPLGRLGNHRELADVAGYLLSDYTGYVNGEVFTIDGGEWLKGAGQFNFLDRLLRRESGRPSARRRSIAPVMPQGNSTAHGCLPS
jgi:Enoyl-(Acyl carrier protein) reductase